MSRLFRRSGARLGSYAALVVFAAAYLAALALVVMPGLVLP